MNYTVNFKNIIVNLINQLSHYDIKFGKTRLIKIAYLLELQYYKINKKRLSDAKWIFFKYGPYPINYCNYLEQDEIHITDDDGFIKIELKEDSELPSIPIEVTTIMNSLIMSYGNMELNQLLNFIYFNTEPMKYAKPKSELDFSKIVEDSEVKKKITIDISKENKIKLLEIRKRLSDALGKMPTPKFQSKFVLEDIFENNDMNLNPIEET